MLTDYKPTKYLKENDVFRYKDKWVTCEFASEEKTCVIVYLKGVKEPIKLTKGYEIISKMMSASASKDKEKEINDKFKNFFK